MNTVRDLKLLPVWVNPNHLAATALHVMLGHGLKILGVLDGAELVGVVGLEDLVGAPEGAVVSQVMRPAGSPVDADSNVRQAAQQLVQLNVDSAPVLDAREFRGILTPLMLLKELGQSYDPLTTLSWSDVLREWGVRHLEGGDEVTIIFIDLNRFGLYNKKYGHIIGDQVIAKVAKFLSEQIDSELDVLVRYGGDEFVIGTLRDRDESEALAELLVKRFDGRMEGADEPVGFTTGVFGGRRHKERESVHYAATIDNLINIASKNCIANKKRDRAESEESQPEPKAAKFGILGIYTDEGDEQGIITVVLSADGKAFSGAESRKGGTVVDAIARATAKALKNASPSVTPEVLAIDLMQDGDSQVVSVTGVAKTGNEERPVSAACKVSADLATAVVEATIEAFRPLA
jgi:GGDEF domain-containing protein